jgi:predicted ATPase
LRPRGWLGGARLDRRRAVRRSLELRAATDSAKVWQKQGRRAEALDVLSSVCGRFNEGFDTCDLKEARDLLAQLQ